MFLDDWFQVQRPRPKFGDKEKKALYAQQNGKCNGCGAKLPLRNLTVDHIRAFSRGGGERLTNLQLLCGSCNSMKGDGTQGQLRKRLAQKGIIQSAKKTTTKKKAPSRRRRPQSDPFNFFNW